MSLSPIPFNTRIRIVDPTSGYLTSQGYRFLEAMRASVIGLEVDAGDGTLASGLLTFEANATPGGGATAQVDAKVKAVAGGVSAEAGWTIRAFVAGETVSSQVLVKAGGFYVTDGTTNTAPFSVVAGVTSLQNVVINGNLVVNGTITGPKIGNLEVGTSKLAYGAVGTYFYATGSALFGASWTTITSLTISNESGLIPMIQAKGTISISAGANPAQGQFRVVRSGAEGTVLYTGGVGVNPGGSNSAFIDNFFIDHNWVSGSATYLLQAIHNEGTSASCSASLYIALNKR